jgi:hypothetical protein
MIRSSYVFVFLAAGVLAVSGAGSSFAQDSLLERGWDYLRKLDPEPTRQTRVTDGDIAKGLREALRIGSERVVKKLGAKDGFNHRTDVHIPLPKTLAKVQSTLARFGVSHVADELELRLNRAAEAAVPRAKKLFWNAVDQMSLQDARSILEGANDSATQYFRAKMVTPLTDEMRPIIDQEIANVGAVRAFDEMMRQYRSFPFVPDARADLTGHVLKRAIDGVFLYLAREEAAIRKDPVKRTTAILRRVFASR